jgi:hypothetical protein
MVLPKATGTFVEAALPMSGRGARFTQQLWVMLNSPTTWTRSSRVDIAGHSLLGEIYFSGVRATSSSTHTRQRAAFWYDR